MYTEFQLLIIRTTIVTGSILLIAGLVLVIFRIKRAKNYAAVLSAGLDNVSIAILSSIKSRSYQYKFQSVAMLFAVILVLVIGAYLLYNTGSLIHKESVDIEIYEREMYKIKVVAKYDNLYQTDYVKNYDRKHYQEDIDNHMSKYDEQVNRSREADRVYFALGAILLRLSIALIMVFLVQIFLRLYRYNLKVSDFYKARFDAWHSYKTLNLEFEKAVAIFYPNIDVGREIKMPVSELVETLKALKEIAK